MNNENENFLIALSEYIRLLYQKLITRITKNSNVAFRERSEQIASPADRKYSCDDTSREMPGAARRGEGVISFVVNALRI